MGLSILVVGLVIFLGTHLFVTKRDERAALIARFGANAYKIVFSLVSLIGLGLIVYGFAQYREHGWIDIWQPPTFMRHIAALLMLFGSIFLVAAYIPSHIKTRLKHPMLAGVKVWALAHLLANGDLGSIILFGSFLAWAVFARIAAKRRGDNGPLTAPPGFRNDVTVVLFGVALYVALAVYFHPYVIGVPVFAR